MHFSDFTLRRVLRHMHRYIAAGEGSCIFFRDAEELLSREELGRRGCAVRSELQQRVRILRIRRPQRNRPSGRWAGRIAGRREEAQLSSRREQ